MPPPISSWADLPIELLDLILPHLSFTDHLRVSTVCVSWRYAMSRSISTHRHPSPWLMLPVAGPTPETAKFYSPADRRTYTMPLPLPPVRGRFCIGSSHGWLVTLSGAEMRDVHLLNPLTRTQIPLPSLPANSRMISRGYLSAIKAALSPPPTKINNKSNAYGGFTVIIIHEPCRKLAYFRDGSHLWTWTFTEGKPDISDFVHCKGKLYTVNGGAIYGWDNGYRNPIFIRNLKYHAKGKKYLVESLDGELLMVMRDKKDTTEFKVKMLDVESKKWYAVEDLASNVLFVGGNYSMSISANKFPEFRRNCIYFTEDVCEWSNHTKLLGKFKRDAGAFDMKTKEVTPLPSDFNLSPSIWFTPSLA